MSLKFSKNGASPYNYVSIGDNTNPISINVIIDKVGGTKTSDSLLIYLVASREGNVNIGNYSDIVLTALSPTDITWQLSLNGTNWFTELTPSNMPCITDNVLPIYVRTIANNAVNTTLVTQKYYSNIRIAAVENPA